MNDRPFDLIYVAQLIERKQPMFVVEVMKRLPDRTILVIGDGPLREQFLQRLADQGTRYLYVNRLDYKEMPRQFAQAKICLFPTLSDTWGIVSNEALAAGCPVITTPEAGCAGDLVIDGENGRILPLDAKEWAEYIEWRLDYASMWPGLPADTVKFLWNYTPANSALAIQQAVEKAMEAKSYRDTRKTYDDICTDCEEKDKCSKPHKEKNCPGDRIG